MLRVVTLIFHESLSGRFVTPPLGGGAGLGTSATSFSGKQPNFRLHTRGGIYLLPFEVILCRLEMLYGRGVYLPTLYLGYHHCITTPVV